MITITELLTALTSLVFLLAAVPVAQEDPTRAVLLGIGGGVWLCVSVGCSVVRELRERL